MKNCIIIGGGVIGLCSAYYLRKAGHNVTIIDRNGFRNGCSYGNAGMIVPSHFIPLAQPGMIRKGMKWMFNSKSPFYIKPRLNLDLLRWGRTFYQHATEEHVNKSIPALLELSLLSRELFQELNQDGGQFEYQEKGLLMLFQSEQLAEEEYHVAQLARELGLKVTDLDQQSISTVETGIKTNALGGVHYIQDAHLTPEKFMAFLLHQLEASGVQLIENVTVETIQTTDGKITGVQSRDNLFSCDELIITSGVWSTELAAKLDVKIPMLAGKGYSFMMDEMINQPTIPTILCDGKVAVTPMGNRVRFGGTMEITHTNDHRINARRLQGITQTIQSFYPEYPIKTPVLKEVWHGFRPCSPTGLPYIGRTDKWSNLVIATGHSMMGLSLAPATGKSVAELVERTKSTVNLTPFGIPG